ncbi:MAG: DUF2812 domain-containing protein [Oscillospiraceae bacterium]|nr:DUF2812 domain-containing protein [Oscillospiraceae bacterium]
MSEKKLKKCYRLPPCPPYDVEGTESWLSDMARDGWLLAEDGLFLGVATFEKSVPVEMTYRLTVAENGTSMWGENNGDPDADEIEHSAMYGWEYIAKRGDFHVYRSAKPMLRELNTDPEVQAIALKELKKRQRGSWLEWIFWIVYFIVRYAKSRIFTTMLYAKTWFMLLAFGVLLWFLINSIVRAVHYRKLRNKLQEQGRLDSGKNWRSGAAKYHIGRFTRYVLVIALVMIFMVNISSTVLGENEIPISEFSEEPPFATIADFAEGEYELQNYGSWGNNVIHWSDWLAPECWRWHEIAKVRTENGTLDGGLYIDYYETAAPWIANIIAKEYYKVARWDKDFEIFEAELPEGNFAACYYDEIHIPTMILQRGNVVINVSFIQYGEGYVMSFEEWTAIVGEYLGK